MIEVKSEANSKITVKSGFDPQWTAMFCDLYNKTELKRSNPEQIQQAFANSQVVVSAWIENKPVAIGRAISDFKMYSSIFDVVVDPEYQKMGLGKTIMKGLLGNLEGTLVFLTSTFGNENFYKKLGFQFHKTALALYPEKMKHSPYLFQKYRLPEDLISYHEITFSLAQNSDNQGCYPLMEQLGYKTDYAGFAKRFQLLMNSPEHSIVVAKSGNEIVGWMHIEIRRHLLGEDFAQIAAIVVAESMRGKGIGKHLNKTAENWSQFFGVATVRLYSSFSRELAHKFYLDNGYAHLKDSKLFLKEI